MSIFKKKPRPPRNNFLLEIPDNTAVTLIANGSQYVVERSGKNLKIIANGLTHYL